MKKLSSFDTSNASLSYMLKGCKATTGYARTEADAAKLNKSVDKPWTLNFVVKANIDKDDKESTDDDFEFIASSYAPNSYTISGQTQKGYFKYIGSDTTVKIPKIIHGNEIKDYYNMFENSNMSKVISDNPNITDMSYMFFHSKATSLDLSSFDTSNVINMNGMFRSSQATSLDLSSLNTSKVTDMSQMFAGSRATSLDLSSFDTSNVTDMYAMFDRSQATSLDLSSFDTSNVTSMYSMFSYSKATSLDLSSFDTQNVITMGKMFLGSQAEILDLSSFNTSKATQYYMEYMFKDSKATTGYARNQKEVNKFNGTSSKSAQLNFIVKP